MDRMSTKAALPLATALLGSAAVFVMSTVLSDRLPDTVTAGGAVALAFLLSLPLAGIPRVDALRSARRRDLALAAGGGVAAFWAAPLITLLFRLTDAPPGSEALFLSTTAWGLFTVLACFAVAAERPGFTAGAGALAATAGGAALLANWERPSSFSPFVRYPVSDVAILAAGLIFALGALALAASARELGPRVVAFLGLGGAAAVGVLAAIPVLTASLGSLALEWPALLALAVATTAFAIGWLQTAHVAGTPRAAVALLGAPAAVTALTLAERATGRLGVDPVVWSGAFGGLAALAAGCFAVMAAEGLQASTAVGAPKPPRAVLPLALAGTVAAAATLALPALSAVADGHGEVPFSVKWEMLGLEAAVPWLVLSVAVLVTAVLFDARRGAVRACWVPGLIAAVVCALAVWPLLDTPLRTWTLWIPAGVQQVYGTEYARFAVAAAPSPLLWVSLALSAVAAGLLGYWAWRSDEASQEATTR